LNTWRKRMDCNICIHLMWFLNVVLPVVIGSYYVLNLNPLLRKSATANIFNPVDYSRLLCFLYLYRGNYALWFTKVKNYESVT
jgi:hypothetical protein